MKKDLLLAKKNLQFARRGHDLLEKKFFALNREEKSLQKTVHKMREALREIMPESDADREIFWQMKDLPADRPPYSLDETTVAFDAAFFLWREIFTREQELADTEARLANLAARARRTKKRVAALGNIVIPKHEQRLKYLSERLEEHERDEAVRGKIARK